MNESPFHISLTPIPEPERNSKKGKKIPENVKTAMVEFQRLYKARYGTTPSVVWDKPWFRVENNPGVKATRFRQLIAQLRH